MGFEDEVEQSFSRPCRQDERQVQADMRTHLIHRPARDIIPPLGGVSSFLLSHVILGGFHATAARLQFQRNSVPSTHIRCMITANRRASATIAFFSNRPFWVKRFQTIHHCSVDVAHGLVLLFGIGTKAVPSWDSRMRWNNLLGGLAVRQRQVQADIRTHLIHRPARDIIPPLGGARVSSYRI